MFFHVGVGESAPKYPRHDSTNSRGVIIHVFSHFLLPTFPFCLEKEFLSKKFSTLHPPTLGCLPRYLLDKISNETAQMGMRNQCPHSITARYIINGLDLTA